MTVDTPVHRDPETAIREWLGLFNAPDTDAAYLLVDSHDPAARALTIVEPAGDALMVVDLTYGEISDQSRRLATALRRRGITQGDAVGVLMGKRAELVITLVALARLGAVYIPLFTAFAPPAIEMRLSAGRAKLVIVEQSQADKVADIGVRTIVTGEEFDDVIRLHEPLEDSVAVGGSGTLVLLFTSGTTGTPKGVPIPVRALAAFSCYMTYGLDVTDDDVFWNAADPGWAYGLYYGILGPMAVGRPNLLLRGEFSPSTTARAMREIGVTNFAAAPTVYRVLSKDTDFIPHRLRRASAAGEPLTPDVLAWSTNALGCLVRDMYGQTEHGMFINNHWHDVLRRDVVAGSMGSTMPGFTTDIIDGQIAIDVAKSPLMFFTSYLNAPDATAARYSPDKKWYLTGDVARVDDDRYFFQARDDDVIIMAGYRIGPFDVESVLITHPLVADVGVVGVPDNLRGEVIEAFVVLTPDAEPSATLEKALQEQVKQQFAAHAYPRRVHFVDELPRTPSGKLQRFRLREI